MNTPSIATDAVPQNVLVSSIQPGQNPRRKFEQAAMQSLEDSIRAQGLHTAILVRHLNDGSLQLVAGERRLRAFKAVYGENALIPALVKPMTDEEAHAAATSENTERQNMTPVEEAEAAAKILGDSRGDRAEAAKRMGWSLSTLDSRLGLMNAISTVREALQDDKILLGHAELIAACRKESQEAALQHLLSRDKLPTVGELKQLIEQLANSLEKAIFPKDDCAGCHHNSSNQGALFGEAIAAGRCTNKQCYDDKTNAVVVARAKILEDEYQVVRIVRTGENLTLTPLRTEGANGVGPEQAKACRTCKDFGAVVSAVPDKMGNVYKDMCMNVVCNKEKAAAFTKSQQAPAPKQDNANGPTADNSATPSTKSAPAKGGSKDKQQAEKPASSEPSNRVKDYREAVWREMFRRAVAALPTVQNRWVLLAICMTRPSVLDHFKLAESGKALLGDEKQTSPLAVIEALANLEEKHLGQLLANIAAHVSSGSMGLELKHVTDILRFFEVPVDKYWKLSQKFCELLTKNELDAVCDEIGLKAAMGADYAKAKNGSKEDFIKAVLSVAGFEYQGAVPQLMKF